jgi:two-component system chemotaxis response regulator CheY
VFNSNYAYNHRILSYGGANFMDTENSYRILVVDDSDFSRNSITQMLDDPRYNVIGEASNAKEAMNILRDRKAHIAIIDVVMPEISGIELAEKITDNFKTTYVIMISSLAQENIIIDSISAGASDFVQKPFNKETLISSIEKVISNFEED